MAIHATAIVHSSAELATDVDVGPFAVIEAGVLIDSGCRVGSHTVLKKGLRLAQNVLIHEGAVLGGAPQDRKFEDTETFAEIGDGTIVREFATVHRSTHPGKATTVGRQCYLMSYSHVAHDCQVEDEATIASYSALAGHIDVGRGAFVSGGVVVHQYSRIGEYAFIGGGSKVNMDVPPFTIVDGVPARIIGLNAVGIKRAGFTEDTVHALKKAYRTVFRSNLPRREALTAIASIEEPEVQRFAGFIRDSERGVCRSR